MINRYADHSSNERTYLAWIRTAIAIMTFGFLIEKFDLFIISIGKNFPDATQLQPSLKAELVGLSFIVVGIIIMNATIRFYRYKKSIESEELMPYSNKKSNIILSTLMGVLALFFLIYLSNKIWSLISQVN